MIMGQNHVVGGVFDRGVWLCGETLCMDAMTSKEPLAWVGPWSSRMWPEPLAMHAVAIQSLVGCMM